MCERSLNQFGWIDSKSTSNLLRSSVNAACMVWSKAHIYTIIAWICYNWYLVILRGGSIKFSKPLCGCDGPWRLASEGLANSYASELVLQLVEFVVDRFCWVRLTFHIVLCIFTKDSVGSSFVMWKVVQANTGPPGPHFIAKGGLALPKMVLGRGQFWQPKVVLVCRW